jgi:hypothetical protein
MITEDVVGSFERDGVALLPGLLSAGEVEVLRRGVERNLADLSPLGMTATKPGQPGAFVEDFRGWEMAPGDAVAFNMLTLHGAAGSPTRRRAFSLRLTGDDVRWAPRPHRTSPPFEDVDLPAGSSLEHERFRVLWRA